MFDRHQKLICTADVQVGYAFVNFTSIRALYAFIQAKVGRKWNMFSSEKVLQVSLAVD
jgi:hypothetical protein